MKQSRSAKARKMKRTRKATSEESDDLAWDFVRACRFINGNREEVADKGISVSTQLYGLFKQSNTGDCDSTVPLKESIAAKYKREAWMRFKGISKRDAMVCTSMYRIDRQFLHTMLTRVLVYLPIVSKSTSIL